MHHLLSIAAGGALGAMARFWLGTHVHRLWMGAWPLGTLLINVGGSLCIGVVFVLLERQQIHPDWRSILVIGFLGAFTTFSTFSLETVELWLKGEWMLATSYAVSTTLSCVLAAGLGVWLTRQLLGA